MSVTKTKYTDVYKDDKGRFFYQIFLGRDAKGKKHFKKGRKDELNRNFTSARAAHIEAQRIKQVYLNVNLGDIAYSSFIKEKFLPKYKADVEESTYDTHQRMFSHGVDYMGNKLLKKITVEDCEQYRTWLLTETGYSQSYASLVYTSFRQSLDYAVEINLIPTNPSMKTKSIPKGKATAKYWTKEEFEKVLASISISSFYEQFIYVTFLFFYRIGCRVSEAGALKWSDIDLDNGKVRFLNNLHYKNKLDYELKPYLKTDSSRRTLTLDDELVEVLKTWKKEQLKYGVKDFVLSYDNCPLNKSTLSRWLKRYSELAGVPRIDGRGLRHSNASYLIAELGADVLTVSRRLGHKTPMTTLKYYAHMFSNNDIELASKMEGSMNIQPAKHSQVKFNGNQHLIGTKLSGLPKVCQNKKKTA
ncbi:MAG: site-specific integrase [Lactobacillus crispatus]|jgi:integrase|nr:site-specific integrase [Lactobacillus crispatus]MCI1334955.1 site-specific integrase [Lactobacillus crispatus]MCI1365639.1 site-specific integrase [Lactobacillus crispatus]MCI1493329.1 site-specific integrase [Lactobacillus crispatus]MCI1523827.1 site-specific integrase [Lactobacillus crispatus]